MNVLFQQHCQGMLWCCSGALWGLSGMKKHESKKSETMASCGFYGHAAGGETCASPSSFSAQRHLTVPGGYRSHVPHWDSPMMCDTQGSHKDLDIYKGHVALSLSSDRVFDDGHSLGTGESLCCRVQGSWVQILSWFHFSPFFQESFYFLKY